MIVSAKRAEESEGEAMTLRHKCPYSSTRARLLGPSELYTNLEHLLELYISFVIDPGYKPFILPILNRCLYLFS